MATFSCAAASCLCIVLGMTGQNEAAEPESDADQNLAIDLPACVTGSYAQEERFHEVEKGRR